MPFSSHGAVSLPSAAAARQLVRQPPLSCSRCRPARGGLCRVGLALAVASGGGHVGLPQERMPLLQSPGRNTRGTDLDIEQLGQSLLATSLKLLPASHGIPTLPTLALLP